MVPSNGNSTSNGKLKNNLLSGNNAIIRLSGRHYKYSCWSNYWLGVFFLINALALLGDGDGSPARRGDDCQGRVIGALHIFKPEQIGNLVGGVHVHGQLVQVAGDVGSL